MRSPGRAGLTGRAGPGWRAWATDADGLPGCHLASERSPRRPAGAAGHLASEGETRRRAVARLVPLIGRCPSLRSSRRPRVWAALLARFPHLRRHSSRRGDTGGACARRRGRVRRPMRAAAARASPTVECRFRTASCRRAPASTASRRGHRRPKTRAGPAACP